MYTCTLLGEWVVFVKIHFQYNLNSHTDYT